MLDSPIVGGEMFFALKGEKQDFMLSPKDQCKKFNPLNGCVIEQNGKILAINSLESTVLNQEFLTLHLNEKTGDINNPETLNAFEKSLTFDASIGNYSNLSEDSPVRKRLEQISDPETQFRLSKILLEGLNNSVCRFGKLDSVKNGDLVSALNYYYKYSRELSAFEQSLPKGFKNSPEFIARNIISQNLSDIRLIPKDFEGKIIDVLKTIKGTSLEVILKKLVDSNLSSEQKALLRNRSYSIALIIGKPELFKTIFDTSLISPDIKRSLLESALKSDVQDYKLPGTVKEIAILLENQTKPKKISNLSVLANDFTKLANNVVVEKKSIISYNLEDLLEKEIKWSLIKTKKAIPTT